MSLSRVTPQAVAKIAAPLTVLVSLLAILALGSVSASAATETPSPWWGITAGSHPTDLRSGVGKNEVQKVTVSKATGGEFALINVNKYLYTDQKEGVALLPWDATAAEVQKGLEAVYGKGNVSVSAGPGATPPAPGEESWSYLITFAGSLASHPVEPVFADAEATSFGGSANLEGAESAVSAKEVTKGTSDGQLVIEAENLGDASANGCSAVPAGTGKYMDAGCSEPAGSAAEGVFEKTPVTITDTLPQGLTAVSAEPGRRGEGTCEVEPSGRTVTCTDEGRLSAYEQIEVQIEVLVEPAAKTGEVNTATVSGGGAAGARTVTHTIEVNGSERFGIESYTLVPENVGGSVDTQAGSHPFQVTSVVNANSAPGVFEEGGQTGGAARLRPRTVALAKDYIARLPAGLVGNPTPFAQCTDAQFDTVQNGFTSCPAASAVGVALLRYSGPSANEAYRAPIFNMTPLPGEPARFGFHAGPVPVFLNASVRTGSDYGVTLSAHNIIQLVWLESVKLTFWGVPGSGLHDRQRGTECLEEFGSCPPSTATAPPPFLIMPTSCRSPWVSTLDADSWPYEEHASEQGEQYRYELPKKLDGCNHLPFSSSIEVKPDVSEGSTPTGLTTYVRVPQTAELNPEGLAESSVRDITVTLPEGVAINPSDANGLEACSEGLVGFTGFEELDGESGPGAATATFTPTLPGSFGASEPLRPGLNFCANASKVGTVRIKTPLLPNPLEGAVYLATQDQNPFGSLIAMYVVAEDPVSGTVVKLPGEVSLNPVTGQLTATFPNSPELPFEVAELHFFGGARAPLSTPPLCGSYTATASLTPWSGNGPSNSSSTFPITSGPNETPCESPRVFQPGFQAGTTSVQAGGYTPLTITMSRPDADQPLGKLSVVFPPGISAGLRGVKLCEEPQAATGECPAESQIGTVTVSAGLGGDPYPVETGRAYITGPYEGDPFGVDVVVPAIAGPFNLGTEVVRSKVDVDPTDAHLTVVSDAFPTILDGIPLELQHINVLVNRPGFVFNPTSCEPMKLTGQLTSTEGATVNVQTPFQVTNCAALSFKPEFKVSTSAKTSRVEGASLHVSLTLPAGAQGTKANVAKVKVSLPKQLPSPLKTLQKACTEKVFAENHSNCPKASRVGEATVSTPVLEGPLSGPAYFVSHGGAKYPELIIVLTGEDGVTVQVHGETFISKQGITTATFSTVPDVPFSNFELTLPKREYPALTANGNLCKGTLSMPTEMVAQNGLVIKQSTKISVMGCPPTRPKSAHKKAAKQKKAKHPKRTKR